MWTMGWFMLVHDWQISWPRNVRVLPWNQGGRFVFNYSKKPRVRTQWFKNLLTEMCLFKTQKYKNLFSQARSSRSLQSTLALRAPRYYGRSLLRTKSRSRAKAIEVWLQMTPAITDSRYYGITDTFVVPKWQFQFVVLTLVKADTTYFSYKINM